MNPLNRPRTGLLVLAIPVVVLGLVTGGYAQPAPAPSTLPAPSDDASRPAAGLPNRPLDKPFLVPDDVEMRARVAESWQQGDTHWLLLEDRVRLQIGHYGFAASTALARFTPSPDHPGARQLIIELHDAQALPGSQRNIAQAPRLMITVATSGQVTLEADLHRPHPTPPPAAAPAVERITAFLNRQHANVQSLPPQVDLAMGTSEQRAKRREDIAAAQLSRLPAPLQRLATNDAPLDADPDAATDPLAQTPGTPGGSTESTPPGQIDAAVVPTPILPVEGAAYYDVQGFAFRFGEQENALVLLGPVNLAYQSRTDDRTVTLKAQNAVVFFDADPADSEAGERPTAPQQIDPGKITGIYLEDNAVISDGEVTLRSPRVFYDLKYNRALMLDAVLYTYEPELKMPLYLRAKTLRQTSADSFTGTQAQLTNSDFAVPHLAIGARRFTIGRSESANGRIRERFRADDITLRASDVPFFYWPVLAGDSREIPLRKFQVSYNSRLGAVVETRWDAFGLVGKEAPAGVNADAIIDYQGEHSIGVGTAIDYNRPDQLGNFDAYLLPSSGGSDEPGGRDEIDPDEDLRGFVRWLHRQRLPGGFDLSLQAAYVSDETFLEEFFEDRAYEDLAYETSAYLRRQEDDWAATGLVQWQANDFLAQLPALQSPGYTVDKLPELGYVVAGRSLWDDRLTWYSETRLSRMRLRFGEDAPSRRSFSDSQAQQLFGLPNADTSFEQFFNDAGLPGGDRLRFDSRQEVTAPLRVGQVDVTPFAVARLTAYDEDFEDFSGESDPARLYGMLGVTLGTEIHRTLTGFRSRLLDIDGLRHVVSPSFTAAYGEATLDAQDLPVYDFDVEPLAQGGIFRFGLTNTFQTRRGGFGRQRTVDWVTLQTDLVLRTEDGEGYNNRGDVIIPRYFGYRPELAVGGDHFYTQLMWMVTDSLGMTGDLTYALDESEVVQWRVLAELDHSPRLRSSVGYTEIEALDAQLLTYGLSYKLTSKYTISASQTLDFSESGESRSLSLALDRELPQVTFRVFASFDQLEDEQSFGIALVPKGLGQSLGTDVFNTRGTN